MELVVGIQLTDRAGICDTHVDLVCTTDVLNKRKVLSAWKPALPWIVIPGFDLFSFDFVTVFCTDFVLNQRFMGLFLEK